MAYDANISFGPGVNGIFTGIGGVNELVADTTTDIPGSEPTVFAGGSFSDPDISGQNVAFRAGAAALIGIYARIDGTLVKVADRNDTQPGSIKPFSTFSVPVISGRSGSLSRRRRFRRDLCRRRRAADRHRPDW